MIGLLFMLFLAAVGATRENMPVSPCPGVLSYEEPQGTDPGRWYGVVNLSTNETLRSLTLNIVFDVKVDVLGTWVGDVSTTDNITFKIEDKDMEINPGTAVPVRFFIKYNSLNKKPNLQAVLLNGREICNTNITRDAGSSSPGSLRPNNDFTMIPPHPTATQYEPPVYYNYENIGDRFDTGDIGYKIPQLKAQPCGKVTLIKPKLLLENRTASLEGQWPWQIALYQSEGLNQKYICGGTLVSHKHIITAAHCITSKGSRETVDKSTLSVHLGKHNLRTSTDGTQTKYVEDILVHPEYNETTFRGNLAILQLKEPVAYTDWVRAACLWPEDRVDFKHIAGRKGSFAGWGYDDMGVATEELTLTEMSIVDQETCNQPYSEFLVPFSSEHAYCAGFKDWTPSCNADSGSGMLFKLGSTWYARGVAMPRGRIYSCDPSHYVSFTDLAKLLPWIKQYISD